MTKILTNLASLLLTSFVGVVAFTIVLAIAMKWVIDVIYINIKYAFTSDPQKKEHLAKSLYLLTSPKDDW